MNFPIDRIQINSTLLVGSFLAVLLLSSQSAASMVTYVLCLVMLARIWQWNDVFRCPMVWPIAALLLYLPLSAFWSTPFDWRDLGSQLIRALLTFTFVVAFAECQLRGKVQAGLGQVLGAVGALVAVLTLVLFMVEAPEDGRLNGLGQLDTPVVAALVFGATFVFVVHGLFLTEHRGWRVLGLVCLIPLGVAVAWSDSRNAWVSVSFGALVMVLAHVSPSRRQFAIWVMLLACVGLSVIYWVANTEELVGSLLPRGDSFRPLIWQATLDRVQETPWLGLGILTEDDVVTTKHTFAHPHNLYLSVLFQGGIVGLGLFVWLLLRTLRETWLNFNHPDAKLALGTLALALPSYLLDGHELLDKVSDTWFLIRMPVALTLGLRWHAGARNARIA